MVQSSEYRMLHLWVEKQLGKPNYCQHCKATSAVRFEWANVSKLYLNEITDWIRLCAKCHRKYDASKLCKRGIHNLDENEYRIPSTGRRQCLACKRAYRKEQYRKFKALKEDVV